MSAKRLTRGEAMTLLKRAIRTAKQCPDPKQQAIVLSTVKLRFARESKYFAGSKEAARAFREGWDDVLDLERMINLRKESESTKQSKSIDSRKTASNEPNESKQVVFTIPLDSQLDLSQVVAMLSPFGRLSSCAIDRASGRVTASFDSTAAREACINGFPRIAS